MKKHSKYLFGIALISVSIFFYSFSSENFLTKLKTLSYIIRLVENYYVEEVDLNKTIDGAIHGLLEELDPHSSYIPSDEFKYMQENLDGEFEGIGIEFAILDGYITVISPIPGTPSDRAGLIGGDKIIRINGNSAYKITQDEVFKKLRGEKGSRVVVDIQRVGISKPLEITLIRDKIPIHSVMASFLYNDNTGYIKVNRFAKQTYNETKSAIDSLQFAGMKNLILDLRNNGGGLMDQAVSILDLFVNSNDTILYTKGRIHDANEVFYAKKNKNDKNIPIIVLINRASASASEIVSGGLQDLDRGLIIGETSFGKGLVQKQFLLDDESAVRITVAQYYTPSGRLIQRKYEDGVDEYYNDLLNSVREENDSTLTNQPIFKTKKGRNVYGGGGIKPDIYISNEIEFSEKTQGVLTHPSRLLFKYANQIKKDFKKSYKSFSKFNKSVKKDRGLIINQKDFIYWVNIQDSTLNVKNNDLNENWLYLENRILADVANALWGKNYYYNILLNEDKQFLISLDHINQAIELVY